MQATMMHMPMTVQMILQHGAADSDKIEFVPREPALQFAELAHLRGLAAECADEVMAAEADRADRDRGFAGEFLGPAGEIEVRAGV